MKYPYIGELLIGTGGVAIFLNDYTAAPLNDSGDNWGESDIFTYSCDFHSPSFKNITPEYLANTYGEVKSPEHTEFIAELCKSNGIELFNNYDEGITHFAINRGEVIFTYGEPAIIDHDKKIIIPLPPKEIGNEALSSDEETELKSRSMASELNSQSNDDEWPKIGDEVICKFCKFKVVAKYNQMLMLATLDDCGFALAGIKDCEKPKTPEDLLIEELQTKLVKNNAVDNWMLAANIISGDIEGLTYKSDIENAVKSVINKNLDGDL